MCDGWHSWQTTHVTFRKYIMGISNVQNVQNPKVYAGDKKFFDCIGLTFKPVFHTIN